MLEIFKEGADAWFQRIKSPIVGSVLLAFVAFNWQPIFFVLFSNDTVLDRFAYFDAQTSLTSLVCYPIVAGLFLGLATPFLNYFGSYAAKWPTEKLRLLQAESANAVLTRKAEMAAEREVASAEFKEAALRDAKASQAIKDAELDDKTREDLEQKIAQESKDTDEQDTGIETNSRFSGLEKALLKVIGKDGGKNLIPEMLIVHGIPFSEDMEDFYASQSQTRLEVDVREALVRLREYGLTESVYNVNGSSGIRLTAKGYREFDQIA